MQFLVIAKDGTDEDAIERRKRVRPSHLEAIQPLVDSGNVLVGGAILTGTGDMIGSVLIVEFPEPEDVHDWLAKDPYVTGGVWRDIEVSPFRTAPGSRRAASGA